ncbi:MAG: hypothetical protein V1858_00505 [Candidatus Gottesmanbacteria bacterium]
MKKISLIIALLTLPFLLLLVQKAQQYLSRATGIPANIIIETKTDLGLLPKPWQALAQGGEEKGQLLTEIVPLVKPLAAKYIRIDHVFDFYDVVQKNQSGQLEYNFSKLDLVINNILASGAKPFISLSYMPPAISSGDITDPPTNWSDWQQVVKTTIEHYSGTNHRNLNEVIYEVWNEPDLFGNWKTYGDHDYRLLYLYAARGANAARDVNSFKIGGPATTAFYKNWLEDVIKYIYQNNLRLDFFSWHRYSLKPQEFLDDINFIDSLLTKQGGSYLLPKYITEWGSTPENSSLHDSNFDAAHTVAVLRQILDRIDLAFTFEIKDGFSPTGEKYWGRWGILTNEKSGLVKKPRYFALALLNQMSGQRIKLSGEGTWVTCFATKDSQIIKALLVNYDQEGSHSENVPITFTNLESGNYTLTQTDLYGKSIITKEIVNNKTLGKNVFMPVNSVILLELAPN